MGISSWLEGLFSDNDEHLSARLGREGGRGPIGAPGTSACPDTARTPCKTPGTCGIGDAAALVAEFGPNPHKLSGKLELHAFSLADVAPDGDATGTALFEYDGVSGKYLEAGKLTYPHASRSRGYYRNGDVILVREVSPAVLVKVHPEVEALIGEWTSMLANSLGMKITIGYVILTMNSMKVAGQLALLFGEDMMCLVEDEVSNWTIDSLESTFRTARADRSGWEFIKKMAPIIANLATGILSGTARSAANAIAFRAAKSQLKEQFGKALLVRSLTGLGANTKEGVKAFAKAAAQKWVEVSLRTESLSLRDGGAVNEAELKQMDVQRILLAGSIAFFDSMISSAGSKVTEGLGTNASGGARRWIAERLTVELVKLIPNMTKTLLNVQASALDDVLQRAPGNADSKQYQEALARKLESGIGGPLESAVRNLLTSSGGLQLE